ncbi:MAG: glycoside hydrolase family 55 protein [Kiritimatiellia bacterium]
MHHSAHTLFGSLILGAALPLLAQSPVHSGWHFTPPANSGVINVRDYGAKGDGVTDDTAAINLAISENIDEHRYRSNPFIWLPNGTYLISGPIESRLVTEGIEQGKVWSAGWRSMLLLMGESRDGVVLRLKDNAPGYGDADKPKWVLATGSEDDNRRNFKGRGNRAFRHMIRNLTVDVGAGNPGAIAIDFMANNRGTVSDVSIRAAAGSGHTGINMTRDWPGPAMIYDVSIDGFARGIAMSHYQFGMTFERILLRGQRRVGISNNNNLLAMRKVIFEGSVPFYESSAGHGMLTLLDSRLTGTGTSNQAAIISGGIVNLRRVEVNGFGTVIRNVAKNGKDLPANSTRATLVRHHDQGLVHDASPNGTSSLDLPIEEFPKQIPPADADWVDGGNSGESLQAAIDSGAEWIYLKPGQTIELEETLIVRGKVKRIQGFSAFLKGPENQIGVRIGEGDSPLVMFDNLYINRGIEQASTRTFAFRHGDLEDVGLHATQAGGKSHVMDIIGRGYQIHAGHQFWGRQVNSEFGEEPLFTNLGGDAWLLGFKMETSPRGSKDSPGSTPSLLNRSGNLEVLGGLLYTLGSRPEHAPRVPAFTNEQGRISLSFRINGRPETYYHTLLRTDSFENGTDLNRREIMGHAPGMALFLDER